MKHTTATIILLLTGLGCSQAPVATDPPQAAARALYHFEQARPAVKAIIPITYAQPYDAPAQQPPASTSWQPVALAYRDGVIACTGLGYGTSGIVPVDTPVYSGEKIEIQFIDPASSKITGWQSSYPWNNFGPPDGPVYEVYAKGGGCSFTLYSDPDLSTPANIDLPPVYAEGEVFGQVLLQ